MLFSVNSAFALAIWWYLDKSGTKSYWQKYFHERITLYLKCDVSGFLSLYHLDSFQGWPVTVKQQRRMLIICEYFVLLCLGGQCNSALFCTGAEYFIHAGTCDIVHILYWTCMCVYMCTCDTHSLQCCWPSLLLPCVCFFHSFAMVISPWYTGVLHDGPAKTPCSFMFTELLRMTRVAEPYGLKRACCRFHNMLGESKLGLKSNIQILRGVRLWIRRNSGLTVFSFCWVLNRMLLVSSSISHRCANTSILQFELLQQGHLALF